VANILFGAGIADARGAVGGIVFTRGAGGAVMRTRIKPNNPASVNQRLRRGTLSLLSSNWSQSLNPQDRALWQDYATGTPWTNKLNQSINLTGMQAYMLINGSRIAAGLALNDTPPSIPGVAVIPTCDITLAKTAHLITIVAAPTGFVPANPLNSFTIATYLMTNAGSESTYRRRRVIELITGNVTPITFPHTVTAGQNLNIGSILPVEITLYDIHGRVSSPFCRSVIIAAP
jgi:hypothetical protein